MRLLFAGTPLFAAKHLQSLIDSEHTICAVYTQADRQAGRGRTLQASEVKQLAQQYALPVKQPTHLLAPDELQILQAWQADVMVVVAYGMIIPEPVLQIPKWGCINVHASLLPRWRGAAPIERALLAGDNSTGISLMQMDKGLDTGPILMQVPCTIIAQDTSASLHDKLQALGINCLMKTLDQLHSGTLKPLLQDDSKSCYAAKIHKADAIIDWSQPAQNIARKVRALHPKPIAESLLADLRLRIWQAQALPQTCHEAPGTLLTADASGIFVATGDGLVQITTLQFPGGKPLTVKAALNGRGSLFKIGLKLG